MPIIEIVEFIIKYGFGITQLIKGIWELVDWIKERDKTLSIGANDMKANLHAMAQKAKDTGDRSDLHAVLLSLMKRKACLDCKGKSA